MKRPDLLVLIAVCEFLSALGILIGITAISSVCFFVPVTWMWGDVLHMGGFGIFVLGVAVLVMVAYFILALMGGIGLLQGKEWGRIVGIVHGALSLFWVPVGTAIGILIIIYLTKQEVREYFAGSS